MRVLLVNPATGGSLFTSPPIGLVYLATSLEAQGHRARVLDCYSFGGTATTEDVGMADVVCITGMSMQHNGIIDTARKVKKCSPRTPVIVGGSHASALPELLLEEPAIDVVMRGECDETLLPLMDTMKWDGPSLDDIQGACYGSHISESAIVQDVDGLPIPDWSYADPRKYSGQQHGFFYEREPVGFVYSSRGCPQRCTFCSHAVSGHRWRPHSPARVVEEVERLTQFGVEEVHFEDDNFSLDRMRAKRILRAITHLELSIAFPNGVRLDTLDSVLLSCMKDAGVYSVAVGVEFGSQRILDGCNKGLTLKKIQSQITKIKRHGLYVQGFFIIGSPREELADVEATIDFAAELDLDAAFFGHYVPLPGSEDFDELVSAGRIDPRTMDWDNLFSVEAHDVSDHLSKEELVRLRGKAYRRFYLRPRIVWGMLRRLNGWNQVKGLLGRARSML